MTEVRININEKDMDAIEDVFFCEIPQEEYEEIRPLLLNVWRQLCEGMEKEK
jgi:hypothetical protein